MKLKYATWINTTRRFNREIYHLRVQPNDKMNHTHIDPYTIRYKRDAEVIAKNRRAMGYKVRIVKVEPEGYRIYWRK